MCPANYICRYDALFRRHVCCGYSAAGACPTGYRTYMSTTKGTPAKCNVNYVRDECPSDFLCATATDSRNNYCCSLENGVCPAGQSPYYHPLTAKTVKCNPSSRISDCPSSYTCSATVAGAIWGFCCSQRITADCPKDSLPYINPLTGDPQKCTIGVTICGGGFECLNKNVNSVIGFCCTETSPEIEKKKPPTRLASRTSRIKGIMTDKRETITYSKTLATESVRTTRTTTLSPIYHTKQLRIIDIQKEIDRQNTLKDKKLKAAVPYGGFRSMDDELRCPDTHRQIFYEDGTFIECHLFKKCPAGLDCLSPQSGFMGKSICCERHEEELSGGFGDIDPYAEEDDLSLSSTADPYCPTVIEGRSCVPGEIQDCPDQEFFCQFNIIRQEFMCCSMGSHLAIRRDGV